MDKAFSTFKSLTQKLDKDINAFRAAIAKMERADLAENSDLLRFYEAEVLKPAAVDCARAARTKMPGRRGRPPLSDKERAERALARASSRKSLVKKDKKTSTKKVSMPKKPAKAISKKVVHASKPQKVSQSLPKKALPAKAAPKPIVTPVSQPSSNVVS